MELTAGAATAEITPAIGLAMGGYSLRKFPAAGTHDPINARILVLGDGRTAVAIIVCDLVATPPALVAAIRASVERATGIAAERVCVAATHTHSGPVFLDSMAGEIATAAARIGDAAARALLEARPVTLKLGTAEVSSVGANRRRPGGPIEHQAHILIADPGPPAAPAFTLVNYACHATVLEHDNLEYSADFPVAMARAIEQAVGGVAIYLQGAAGDINPVWMRHDFGDVDRVGGILAGAAIRAVHELRPAGLGQRVINLSWDEEVEVATAGQALRPSSLATARVFLDLPRRILPTADELERSYQERRTAFEALAADDLAGRRALKPLVNELRMARSRKRHFPAGPGQTQRVEVQAFRIAADCAVLALPGEFFVEIGQELRRRSAFANLLIAGYANDFVSYVPQAKDFDDHGYEIGSALFAPEAATMVVDGALAILSKLAGSVDDD